MRKRQRKRFDHGEPIAKIDTRPLAFVMVFLVIVIAIARYPGLDFAPDVELPIAKGNPASYLENQFVITVTTTSIQRGNLLWERTLTGNHGLCRAFIGNGDAVTSDELYESAFRWLDNSVSTGSDIEYVWYGQEVAPAYVRAGSDVPWQCVGGVIHAVERAGFNQIRFLTTPPPPGPNAFPPPPIPPDRSA